jgi:hypothetical protein
MASTDGFRKAQPRDTKCGRVAVRLRRCECDRRSSQRRRRVRLASGLAVAGSRLRRVVRSIAMSRHARCPHVKELFLISASRIAVPSMRPMTRQRQIAPDTMTAGLKVVVDSHVAPPGHRQLTKRSVTSMVRGVWHLKRALWVHSARRL